jgi:hypothetical protein
MRRKTLDWAVDLNALENRNSQDTKAVEWNLQNIHGPLQLRTNRFCCALVASPSNHTQVRVMVEQPGEDN